MTIKILLCLDAEDYQRLPEDMKQQVLALLQPNSHEGQAAIQSAVTTATAGVRMLPTNISTPMSDALAAGVSPQQPDQEAPRKRVRKPKAAATPAPDVAPTQAMPAAQFIPQQQPQQFVPPQQPIPQSYVSGDVRVFPASTGHITQQNMAYDITARAPIQIPGAQPGPHVPQLQNAPVQVVPAMTQFQSQQPAPGVVSVDQVRMMAMQLFRDPSRGGQAALQAALTASGVGSLQNLTEANALGLYQYLQRSGG